MAKLLFLYNTREKDLTHDLRELLAKLNIDENILLSPKLEKI